MARLIRDVSLVVLITILFLIAINMGAWVYLGNTSNNDRDWKGKWQISPQSRRGIEIRKRVLDTDDEAYLESLESGPVLRPHTVLHFTNGNSTDEYTVGVEAIRYESGWTDELVNQKMASDNTVYVFGGSTNFGHGVSSDNTIASFLNDQDPDHIYLNFGINSYDSIREVDKLLYLLRQGFRPKKVIFIDGLNDLTTFASAPYRAHDKPRTQGFLIGRGKPALIFGVINSTNMLLAFAYSLPITHLYYQLAKPEPNVPYGTLDANRDPLDYRMLAYYYRNQFIYADENLHTIQTDWVQFYRENIKFVKQLEDAFGFEAYFYFQPFGILEPENPFLTPVYFDSIAIRIAQTFTKGASLAINEGSLDMIDCQDAFSAIDKSAAFVDATHYSPSGNEALASCILAGMEKP